MSFNTGFEISTLDIETVLRQNATSVANADGKSFAGMSEHIFNEWIGDVQFGRIADAAMATGTDMDTQTEGAFAEIRIILVEEGILKH